MCLYVERRFVLGSDNFFKQIFFVFTYSFALGLSCNMSDWVPWLGIKPGSLALAAWSLNHWTTREVLIKSFFWLLFGFPGGSNGKESACKCRRPRFNSWVRKIPWRRAWQVTPVFLPGESHGQRSLEGYRPQNHKEPDMTEQLTLGLLIFAYWNTLNVWWWIKL